LLIFEAGRTRKRFWQKRFGVRPASNITSCNLFKFFMCNSFTKVVV
jgi:hypothetical protein